MCHIMQESCKKTDISLASARYAQDLCKKDFASNLESCINFLQDSCKFLHILAGQFYLGSVMKTFACFVPLIVSLQGNIVYIKPTGFFNLQVYQGDLKPSRLTAKSTIILVHLIHTTFSYINYINLSIIVNLTTLQ